MPRVDLEGILDRLYGAPLGDFVVLRNEAAKELRAAGDREAADRVKALKKPSPAAWVVNQLHLQGHQGLADLADATAAVARAHAEPGARVQDQVQERRRRLDQVVEDARDLLEQAGHGTTREQMRRVVGTIEGATAVGSEEQPGRLTSDLEAPGFSALAGLSLAAAPSAGTSAPARKPAAKPPARSTAGSKAGSKPKKATPKAAPKQRAPATDDRDRQQAALQAQLQLEETRGERAEREVTRADTAHLAARRRIDRAQARIEELEERLTAARTALDEARSEADARAGELGEARDAQARASERLREARERTKANAEDGTNA